MIMRKCRTMKVWKKSVSLLLAVLTVLTVMTVGVVPVTLKAEAASWNGYNYGGGTLYGSQSFLEAFGIDYDEYMHWMDTHDKDSANPNYYLGTPYAHNDHRNPRGDCAGARGAYDTPGVAAMNCTGFVWHVLYKSAVASGAPSYKINRLSVMGGVPASWNYYDVYRIWFDSVDDAYASGVLEKGDLMWLYSTGDNHNAIFYGDSPKDWIYWDSAGERNRYCEVHAIGESRGLWVAKVAKPNKIELHIDTASGGSGTKFGTKYMVFNSKAKAQAALDHPNDDKYWDQREGTIVLDSKGHGCFRKQSAPSASELWSGDKPRTDHSYFKSDAKRVDSSDTYYAVQWSHGSGISEDNTIHTFTDSGNRTGSGYRIYRFFAPIRVDTPKLSSTASTSDGVQLKWNAVKGAYKYRVYYKNKNNNWVRMTETASTSYIDEDVRDGGTYTYTIRCVDQGGNFISEYDKTGWKHTYHILDTPVFTSLESTAEGVKLSWNAVKNTIDDAVTRYRVYYKSKKYGWKMMTETTDTTYTDADVAKNTAYTYTIRCVDAKGNFVSKYNTTGWNHTYQGVNTPQLTEMTDEAEGIRLKWNAIDNVYAYRIYHKTSDGWQRIAQVKDTEYFDKDIEAGETYTYTIRCVNSADKFVSDFNADGWKVKYTGVETPQITEIGSDANGVSMTWDAVENATIYRVYRKTAGKGWTRLAELTDTAYADKSCKLGAEYIYTIRCVNDKGGFMSGYDKNGWKATYSGVETPAFTEVNSEPEGVRLKWNAIDGVTAYRVYARGSNGWDRLIETKDTEFFDDKLSVGTTRRYTIRAINDHSDFASGYNEKGWTITYSGVAMPQITALESAENGVSIGWDAVEGAVQYRVFRKNKNGWDRLGVTEGTAFVDTTAEAGKTYIYTVRCLGCKDNYISDYDHTGGKITYQPPVKLEPTELPE